MLTVLQEGDRNSKAPYTIAIIANPALEKTTNSGTFEPDPILQDQTGFDASATYICDALFGRLPNQAERLLADPKIGPRIRIIKIFDKTLTATDANSLVAQFGSNLVEPRRDRFNAFLKRFGVSADLAYAVTASKTHNRATAWFTTDDQTRGGTPFKVDGVKFTHWHFCETPGTIALPVSAHSLTALHEFGHAASSFSDGKVIDQYVDNVVGLNNKRGRPIPTQFGSLDAKNHKSDLTRDGLGYPGDWASYHPELTDPATPSLMDNYWQAPGGIPEKCQFDKLTRQFFFDRLTAKLSRK